MSLAAFDDLTQENDDQASSQEAHIVDLSQEMVPTFYPCYWDRKRFLISYGGAGSGKSHFAAQKVILRTMSETPHTFLVVRKVASTIRNSCFALIKSYIIKWNVAHLFAIKESELSMVYKPNGNQILFLGLDDSEKLKSITGAAGLGITSVWIEEATELTELDFTQINLRLRGKFENYKQIILTFNPIDEHHWLNERFFVKLADEDREVTTVHNSTFEDNPFIDEEYKAELRRLERLDETLYLIYALGKWGTIKGLIFKNWDRLSLKVEPDETIWGLDWGFNNPSALVRVQLKDREPYVKCVYYERQKTTADIISVLEELGVSKDDPIYADSAEPDRIEEVAREGWNIFPAVKGQGSVNSGISFMQALKLHVDEEDEWTPRELQSYKWAEDKNGKPKDEPVKFNDHAISATRYALHSHYLTNEGFELEVI